MLHTRLSQKSELNNFSQWLEPGKKDNVPTCWDSERACTGQSPRMWKIEQSKKFWKLPIYHHGGYSIWSWDILGFFYIITISLAVEEDEEF